MANEKKIKVGMTTRDFINGFLSGKTKDDVLNGMTYEQKANELLSAMDKRNADKKEKVKSGEPSKTYVENAPLREKVMAYLSEQSESVVAKTIAEALDLTVPKTTAVIRQMVEDGTVERIDLGRNKPLEYKVKG